MLKERMITGSAAALISVIMGCTIAVTIPEETAKAAEIVAIKIVDENAKAVVEAVEPEAEESEAINNFISVGIEEPTADDTYICKEYQEYIYEISEEYCVCPELIMAIVERESSGRADAENGGCKGLMQVSEKWHKDRMERLGVESLYDPYGNILVGTDYLMELAERYGDIYTVLMVYNGTSNAVTKAEAGEYSSYAIGIVERSEQLERLHEKVGE